MLGVHWREMVVEPVGTAPRMVGGEGGTVAVCVCECVCDRVRVVKK